jgi:hypothetical protein
MNIHETETNDGAYRPNYLVYTRMRRFAGEIQGLLL